MSTQQQYNINQAGIQQADKAILTAKKSAKIPLDYYKKFASPYLAEKLHFPRGKWAKPAKKGCANSGENPGAKSLDFRVIRWALQAAAREIVPSKGLQYCLRMLVPDKSDVEVWRHDETGRAHYKNLCVCGSVWTCAPCSSKISEGRRVELKEAMNRADEYSFFMVTFTVSHKRTDKLDSLVDDLLASYRRLTSGKAYQSFAERSGIVGNIKSLEVTYSDRNGFHPHLHLLLCTERGSKVDRKWLKNKWQSVIRSNGRTADYSIGCHFSDKNDLSVSEYIAKYGHEPIKDWWGASGELTKGASKLSRDAKGYSMFQVLYNSIVDPDAKGRAKWKRIFIEYAAAFKGKSQLRYSKGLRQLLGLGVEKTDQELAEGDEHPSSLIASLSVRQWRIVLANDARGEILSAAEKGLQALEDFLGAIGARRIDGDDLQRRRVHALTMANTPRQSKPS